MVSGRDKEGTSATQVSWIGERRWLGRVKQTHVAQRGLPNTTILILTLNSFPPDSLLNIELAKGHDNYDHTDRHPDPASPREIHEPDQTTN
jgi:hypothetical protein